MSNLQLKIDAVMRLATANTIEERNAALEEVCRLLEEPSAPVLDAESIIQDILLEIGAPDHLKGYPMVIEGVMIALESAEHNIDLIHFLYPKIAEAFDSTRERTERAIRHLIERTWLIGNPDAQYQLFGSTIDPEKGKPTNGQFISRLTNITRQRLKMA